MTNKTKRRFRRMFAAMQAILFLLTMCALLTAPLFGTP